VYHFTDIYTLHIFTVWPFELSLFTVVCSESRIGFIKFSEGLIDFPPSYLVL
jgi:hypothetical protein